MANSYLLENNGLSRNHSGRRVKIEFRWSLKRRVDRTGREAKERICSA